MKDLISVIVPIYNIERCVPKCIESIMRQTYRNLEIILVDDGSTDRSGAICDEYAKQDDRIKVIHKQNEGLSDARNSGIAICQGKYIGFVDGDDWLADDMYEFLYRTLTENDADISVCGHYVEDDTGVYDTECADGSVRFYNCREAVCAVVRDEEIHSYAWDKLYKKELFEGIRYPSGRYVQDIFTTYRVFMNVKKIVCNNQPKYYYYQRKDSIQRTRGEKLNWDQFCVYREQIDVLQKEYSELREFLVTRLVGFGIAAYNCLLLQKELTEGQKEHQDIIISTLLDNAKEIYKLPGKVKLKIRLFCTLQKWYPRVYCKIKRTDDSM